MGIQIRIFKYTCIANSFRSKTRTCW